MSCNASDVNVVSLSFEIPCCAFWCGCEAVRCPRDEMQRGERRRRDVASAHGQGD